MTGNVVDIVSRSRGGGSAPPTLEASELVASSLLETLVRLLAEKGVIDREKADQALRVATPRGRVEC